MDFSGVTEENGKALVDMMFNTEIERDPISDPLENPSDVIDFTSASSKNKSDAIIPTMNTFEAGLDNLKKTKTMCIGCYLNQMERELKTVLHDEICKLVFLYADHIDERLINFRKTAPDGTMAKSITEPFVERRLTVSYEAILWESKERVPVYDHFKFIDIRSMRAGLQEKNKKIVETKEILSRSRCKFSDIQSICAGHSGKNSNIDPALCLCVIGKNQSLHLQMPDEELVKVWVSGLKLLWMEWKADHFYFDAWDPSKKEFQSTTK